jgi:hypothetical protein
MLKSFAPYTQEDLDFIEVADNSDPEDSAGHSKLIDAISQLDKTGNKKR